MISGHQPALDGVRAASIVAVLVTHLLPVRFGNHTWNDSVGMFGMALFFVLSGYLITTQLLARPSVRAFACRRLFRVVPAAWLCIALVALFVPFSPLAVLGNLFFVANLPPQALVHPIDHFWSLCLEIQFYLAAAVLLWLRPVWTWYLLPALLLAVTGLRLWFGVSASSVTWFRADDLLAGAVLALLVHSAWWPRAARWLARPGLSWVLLLLLIAGSVLPHQGSSPLTYCRPYIASAFVGSLLAWPEGRMARWLGHPAAAYIASISFALYVWHPPLAATWLGSGDLVEKYLKRPLLLAVLWGVAHLSTFHVERHFIAWGRRLGQGPGKPGALP